MFYDTTGWLLVILDREMINHNEFKVRLVGEARWFVKRKRDDFPSIGLFELGESCKFWLARNVQPVVLGMMHQSWVS